MKRILKWAALVVGAIVLSLAAVVFSSLYGLAPIADGQELDGVTVVKDGTVACYIVDLGEGRVALVDACNDTSAEALLRALGKRSLGPDAVQTILLTHGDGDHTNGVLAFPRAQVMALAPDIPLAEGRESRGLLPPSDIGVRVGRALADDERVDVGGVSFQVYEVPGHTKGSAAFLAKGVLFMGDSCEATDDGALEPAKRLMSSDPAGNREALGRLAERLAPAATDIRVIAPSHSGALIKGLAPLLELTRAH